MSWKFINNANSWHEFIVAMEPLRQEQRGKVFELLAELFLQIDPIYRSKLKHVWHESNLPPSVRQKLGLPSPDIGVDLVAEDTSGEYWAIQCKYHHDPSKNVTKNELNSFLDVTTRVCRGNFKTLLAVSSAHGYSIHLRKHAPEVQYLLSDTFQSLDEDFFRQARALIRKQTPTLKKRSPRPHQKTAIKNAVEHFATNKEKRGKLIHPCGTGKSLIGYWIAEALEAKTIIVALPSLYLVRQTLADWTKESLALKKQMDWMVVCSEDTIGNSGDPAMRFQEIGVDVTTKVDDISAFLRKRSRGQKVIFTTYQSGVVSAKAARKANRIFDVGIFDEAHRTVGQSDSMFAHLVDEKNIRIRKRVFMTATERRYQGSSETILSMDDVDAYGDTFDKMTFREALEQPKPILSDYKIVTMFIGKSEIQHLIEENFLVKPDKGKWDDDTEARSLAALIALRKAMKKQRANHALTFHNSIAKAEAFKKSQERFNQAVKGYGKVDCYHVSSKVSTGERRQELERFRHSKTALITNAKCLTEGVDVPTIDAVLFADTKRSTVDIVQAAGRALRTAEGKKMGYIVIPVLVDEEDPEAADKAFQDILMTLRAMASNDDRIIDYFRRVSQGKRPSKSNSIIDFVIPDPIKVRLGDFVENIETQSWHRLAKLSWMPFEEARKFARSLELKNQREWHLYSKGELPNKKSKPSDVPSNPNRKYASSGWQSWGDWLGTGARHPGDHSFIPFDDARQFARKLNLTGANEWQKYCNGELASKFPLPENIPRTPHYFYRNSGWVGYGDWCGTDITPTYERSYRDFKEARKFVHELGLKSSSEWQKYCVGEYESEIPLPSDIPKAPHHIYKSDGWLGYPDWLGTDRKSIKYQNWRPFGKARAFARKLGLSGQSEWGKYCRGELGDYAKKPVDIPAHPDRIYKDEKWAGYGDWLGTGGTYRKRVEMLPFKSARKFARSLNLTSAAKWKQYSAGRLNRLPKRPPNVPTHPESVYRNKGWISWPDWLGTD